MYSDLILGVDIGGTKIAAAVARSTGEILESSTRPTDARSDAAVVEGILGSLQAVLDAAGLDATEIAAVGVGAPGGVDLDNRTWFGSTNLHLASPPLPLARLLEEQLNRPVFIDNDVKAGALGEWRFGAGRGLENLVYLSVGTGIAAGLIVEGKLYRGVRAAGEIGHVPIEPNGPVCNCGARGCLEVMASGASIARRGRDAMLGGRPTLIFELAHGDADKVTGQLVTQAACQGDGLARAILEDAATYLATGILLAFRSYDPQKLVLAGGVTLAGDLLLDPLRNALDRQTGGRAAGILDRVTLSALGSHAGVLGAIAVAAMQIAKTQSA